MDTFITLCHLGDHCATGIIINDILCQKTKHLFMLGIYKFNDILHYLKDNNYNKIYDKNNFFIAEDGILNQPCIFHNDYNFGFNHDYKIINDEIINYDLIKERFELKIINFKKILSEEKMCIFINFTDNVDVLEINEMLNWLNNNKKNFHLIIFTDKSFSFQHNLPNLSIILLKKTFNNWFLMPFKEKFCLYNEIYNEFINCLRCNSIIHNFPEKIEHTPFFFNNLIDILLMVFINNFSS
jgi:hypothetical protein